MTKDLVYLQCCSSETGSGGGGGDSENSSTTEFEDVLNGIREEYMGDEGGDEDSEADSGRGSEAGISETGRKRQRQH